MKGFIEVTDERGTKHLVNIRHIEEVMNSTIYLDVVNPHCDEQDHIFCEESYKKIIVKIAKAVGEDKRLIPQKPDIEGDGYDEKGELIYDIGFCPNCRQEFEIYYDATKYCPNCGQKLDWSNVKDLVIGDDVVMPALDISQQKTDEELIARYYENANKEWIIT